MSRRNILDVILGRKTDRQTLDDLEPRAIEKEIRRQELSVERIEGDVAKLETEAQVLFQKSVGKSEHQKLIIAHQIKDKKRRITNNLVNLNKISRAMGVLYTVKSVIEKAKVTFKGEVWDTIINNITIDELESWVIEEKLNDEEILNKFRELERLKFPEQYASETDEDLEEIIQAMGVLEAGQKDAEEITKSYVSPETETEKESA